MVNDAAAPLAGESLAACARALAGGASRSRVEPPGVTARDAGALPVEARRGASDASAMRTLHHDRVVHARARAHADGVEQGLDSLEMLRCLALGTRRFPGIAVNGATLAEFMDATTTVAAARPMSTAWHALNAHDAPPRLQDPALVGMHASLSDQALFARWACEWLRKWSPETRAPPSGADPPLALPQGRMPWQAWFDGFGRADADGPGGAGLIEWESQRTENGYQMFTAAFDEILDAKAICDATQAGRLRERWLDADDRGNVARVLARRFASMLRARRRLAWRIGCEEGDLDPGRLARLAVNPVDPLCFRQPTQEVAHDTAVTFLVDVSGSMRGTPLRRVLKVVDLLVAALERNGVICEVLAHTTRGWEGGRARAQWLAAGAQPHPGRLNELRLIVVKSAAMPWGRARHWLGALLQPGLHRENIDGEALAWACRRLQSLPQTRRLLVAVGDGSPHDTATAQANVPGYLEDHLGAVVRRIARTRQVQLAAIVPHATARLAYPNVLVSPGFGDAGAQMISMLCSWLTQMDAARIRRRN